MAELSVARRYARALFDTANRAGSVEQVEEDLKGVYDVMQAAPRLERVLRAPTISSQRKRELLTQTFQSRVSPLTLRFLILLVDRRREDILKDVYGEYRRLADAYRNMLPVEVTAAVPLTDEERDTLVSGLSRRTGKRVTVRISIHPEIMGGLILRLGDTVIDGSVRTRLSQLREQLTTGRLR